MLPPPARVAAVVEHVLRRKLVMLGAQVLVEHRRRLDDVVVDTRDDHVFQAHLFLHGSRNKNDVVSVRRID